MSDPAGLTVLHVCECLMGGTASYFEEILPAQIARYGAGRVALLAPSRELAAFPTIEGLVRLDYRQDRRSPGALVRLGRAVRQALTIHAPALVHLHSTVAGAVGRIALRSLRRRPRVVYCAHGWMIDPDRETKHNGVLVAMERGLSRLTDRIVNISPHETRFLAAQGFDQARMTLIVSGIRNRAPAPFAIRPDSDGSPIRLLFIGRLDQQKGFDLLLAALRHVPLGKVKLTVIGAALKGGDPVDLSHPAIDHKGWLPREAVAEAIADADAVVMPSRWEGLPLVALETMRAGRALIATNAGAFPDMIEDGTMGLLVDHHDPRFLADALVRVDADALRRMGLAARDRFVRRFDADRMNRDLLALYDELVPPEARP
jgi:glycosyltransferase involved in cell wall biosynthesis